MPKVELYPHKQHRRSYSAYSGVSYLRVLYRLRIFQQKFATLKCSDQLQNPFLLPKKVTQSSDNINIFNVKSYLLLMRLFWHHALTYASSSDLNVCRYLGAVLSDKRFLAGVWKHVTLQTIWLTASVVALLTEKEFFSSVRGLVILEMTSTISRIVALLTSEMPFSWTNGCALCILRFWGVVRVLLHCEQPKGCVNKRLLCWMGEQVFFEVISLCTWVLSSCIVCKQRISLPSVWACVSWGSQPVCRRSCTVCKQQASLQCELAHPQSLFYFVPQEISQPSRIGFCEPEHVSFQFGSTGGWVAAQVAAVGDHTEDMSKVCLQFVFQFPWLVLRSGVAMVLLNQSGSTVEGWLKKAEAVSRVWVSFKKWR